MLVVRRNQIFKDGYAIGFYRHHDSGYVTLAQVTPLFESSPSCIAVLSRMQLPATFKYIWISDIAVRPEWRRKGIASDLINQVAGPNTLLACALGSGSMGRMRMKHQHRIAFYKSLGFHVVIGTSHDYAFRYGKKET